MACASTTAWSKVKAFDARTGAPLWSFDPKVPGQAAVLRELGYTNLVESASIDEVHRFLLTGIAAHQQQLAGRVLEQWQAKDGMLAQLSQFPNARFADGQEAVAELLRTQVNALELLKKKLEG